MEATTSLIRIIKMLKRKEYYWKNIKDFALYIYTKKRNQEKILISDINPWLERKLKDPIFAKKVESSMEAENKRLYEAKIAGPSAIPEDTKKEMTDNLRQSVLDDRNENPEKYKKIHEDIVSTLRENGTYERNGNSWKERRMQETPEERSALSRYANECMSPETRERIRLNGIKTNNRMVL